MQITPAEAHALGPFTWLKRPEIGGPPAQRDPHVIERVSEMLADIERNGLDAVRRYARELDGWTGDLEVGPQDLRRSGDALPGDVRAALELGYQRTNQFATAQRANLSDFAVEVVPGVVAGVQYIPVGRVGAYLPAGRFPLLAGAFMTVGVAKAAGVPTVLACTPPSGSAVRIPPCCTGRTCRARTGCSRSVAFRHWVPWHSEFSTASRST